MKIFVYCFREFDEKEFFDELTEKYGCTYGYSADYPNLENAKLVEGYDAVSTTVCDINAKLLDCFHELGVKYVATRSIGYDHIDIEHAKRIGMKVSKVNYAPDSVAEYTVMLMMMGCRRICHILDRAKIQDFSLKGKLGNNLGDCTVGVIGTGQIGVAVIKYLKAFGCRILANDSHQKEELSELLEYTDLNILLKESEIITLHVPAHKENNYLLDKEAFEIMKHGVMIVNTARGTLIDTDALIDAIEEGKIGHVAGHFLFTSGQGGLNPFDGSVVEGGIEAQAEQTMKNLSELFQAAGTNFTKTVKTTCFLADMSDFAAFNQVYGKYFTGKPARSCVAVKTLPLGILCEVEAIVYLGE